MRLRAPMLPGTASETHAARQLVPFSSQPPATPFSYPPSVRPPPPQFGYTPPIIPAAQESTQFLKETKQEVQDVFPYTSQFT